MRGRKSLAADSWAPACNQKTQYIYIYIYIEYTSTVGLLCVSSDKGACASGPHLQLRTAFLRTSHPRCSFATLATLARSSPLSLHSFHRGRSSRRKPQRKQVWGHGQAFVKYELSESAAAALAWCDTMYRGRRLHEAWLTAQILSLLSKESLVWLCPACEFFPFPKSAARKARVLVQLGLGVLDSLFARPFPGRLRQPDASSPAPPRTCFGRCGHCLRSHRLTLF